MKKRGREVNRIFGTSFGVADKYSLEIDFKAIGQKLKMERKKMGWTQEEVAELIDLAPAFVGHLERGERSMSLKTLIHFSNLYGVSIDYLLSDTLQMDRDNVSAQIAALLKDKTEKQQAAILDVLKTVERHV